MKRRGSGLGRAAWWTCAALAWAWGLAGCGDTEKVVEQLVDPCAGAPCGEGELCAVSGAEALCVCAPGLDRVEGACVEASAGASPSACDGVPCGDDGVCAVAQSGPVCLCGSGGVSLSGPCPPPSAAGAPDAGGPDAGAGNPCAGVDCGGGGQCVVTGAGAPLCICDEGHHRRRGGCVPTLDPCADAECGEAGSCVVTRGGPVCLCGPGYVSAGDACEPASPSAPCAGIDCGPGGTCAPLPSGPLCLCGPDRLRAGATQCVPADNPCEGVGCAGLGTCIADGAGKPVCLCQGGAISVGTSCELPPEGAMPQVAASRTELAEPHPEVGAEYVPGELAAFAVVGHDPAVIHSIAAAHDAEVLAYHPALRMYHLRTAEALSAYALEPLIDALVDSAQCHTVIEQFLVGNQAGPVQPKIPNDPAWGAVSWVDGVVSGANWNLKAVGADLAWGYSTGRPQIRLGIVDTGALVQADLGASVLGAAMGPQDVHQPGNHATQVLGVAAAVGNNQQGLTGVVWNANRLYCPLGDKSATLQNVLVCIHALIDIGARAINLSQGVKFRKPCWWHDAWECQFEAGAPPEQTAEGPKKLAAWQKVFLEALGPKVTADHRWILVGGAGNEALVDSRYGNPLLGLPVGWAAERVVGVAASTIGGNLAPYSNRGSGVYLAAPGGHPYGAGVTVLGTGPNPVQERGTSFAAPLVAGAIALAWSMDDTLTPGQITSMMVNAAQSSGQSTGGAYDYPILDVLGLAQAVVAHCAAAGRPFNYSTGRCAEAGCVPNCAGKVCGPDGCGGTCGDLLTSTCEGDVLKSCVDGAQVVSVDCAEQGQACGTGGAGFAHCLPGAQLEPPHGSIVEPASGTVVSGPFDVKVAVYAGGGSINKFTVHISGPPGLVYNQSIIAKADNIKQNTGTFYPDATGWPPGIYTVALWVDNTHQAVEAAKITLQVQSSAPAGCTPMCVGKDCGPDGCGGSCGACLSSELCTPGGICVNVSTTDDMVVVPAGTFWRGCNELVDDSCSSNEKPEMQIYLDTFHIDRLEVTNKEFTAFLNEAAPDNVCGTGACLNASQYTSVKFILGGWFVQNNREQHPMARVTWFGADAYCAWVDKRLCTEAEWEKAARGTDGRKYPWGNSEPNCDLAVFHSGGSGCGTGSTWPVGSKPQGASPYGALDMAGNVREWVADRYSAGYYSVSPASNPQGPESGSTRVRRGGRFNVSASYLRASIRYYNTPSHTNEDVGFRCCRSAP